MRELERSISCAELAGWEGYFALALEERNAATEKGYFNPTFWD